MISVIEHFNLGGLGGGGGGEPDNVDLLKICE